MGPGRGRETGVAKGPDPWARAPSERPYTGPVPRGGPQGRAAGARGGRRCPRVWCWPRIRRCPRIRCCPRIQCCPRVGAGRGRPRTCARGWGRPRPSELHSVLAGTAGR